MDVGRPILLEFLQSLCRVVRSNQRVGGNSGQLQPVHIEALSYLDRANRYSNTPQALAEYLHSTKGTVSQSLLLLYRRGLITRKADRKDGGTRTARADLVQSYRTAAAGEADLAVFAGLGSSVKTLSGRLPGWHPLLRKHMRRLASALP